LTPSEMRELREAMRLTKKELAKEIGQCRNWISDQEHRGCDVSAKTENLMRQLARKKLESQQ